MWDKAVRDLLLNEVLGGLADLVFPPRCACCDMPGSLLCPSCACQLQRIERTASCARCGAPLLAGRCVECAGREFAFQEARAVGVFSAPLSDLITVYKDAGERRLVPLLGELLAEVIGPDVDGETIVPVACRPQAVRRRGFDHIALVARDAGARRGLPVCSVLRTASGADQRQLGRERRRMNAEGRFSIRPGAAIPSRVVLVDDVFTTGSTLDACAGVLLAAGCEHVRVAVLARATDVVAASG